MTCVVDLQHQPAVVFHLLQGLAEVAHTPRDRPHSGDVLPLLVAVADALPEAHDRRALHVAGGITLPLAAALQLHIEAAQLVVELQRLIPIARHGQLEPHRSARFAGSHDRLLVWPLPQRRNRAGRIHQQRLHCAIVRGRRRKPRLSTHGQRRLVRGLHILGVEVQPPSSARAVRVRDDPGDRHPLFRCHSVAGIFVAEFPPEQRAVEFLGLVQVAGDKRLPHGHSGVRNHCWHYMFLHFSGSKSSSAVASSKYSPRSSSGSPP